MSKRKRVFIIFAALLLLLTACSSGGQVMDGEVMVRSYTQISQDEAKQMMQQDDGHVIVDVRRPDEFAAGLLMPERMILKSRFSSVSQLAEAFLVSDQACYKRLNNLKQLDRIGKPEPAPCSVCGNGRISPAAEYCGICGALLAASPQTGVRVVE